MERQDDTQLRSVDELPERYRQVFATRFGHFNRIQSQILDHVIGTHKSLVICSPTASGKTVLLELAIVHELCRLESSNDQPNFSRRLHVLYIAPLKAIIEEKCAEWSRRFSPFGLKCFTLTGDTEHDQYQLFRASDVNILFATPEKFDSMIRTRADSRQLLRLLQLVLIDEIHMIADRVRGDVLEATLTRIKAIRGSSKSSAEHLRFVAISATAPNVDDLAAWLDFENGLGIRVPQHFRPVKLTKLVFGFEPIQTAISSEYRFDIQLSYRLEKYIRDYCSSKPSLVFCATRRSAEFTAKVLASSTLTYFESPEQRTRLFYELSKLSQQEMDPQAIYTTQPNFKNAELKVTLASGVAFYHSGMDHQDRRLLEQLFAMSLIPVLIATSSLAMGVNLPAHLVVIKNTVQYNAGSTSEYDLSQILQMLGRAGRPQHDTEAKAIIMTKAEKKENYESMLNKQKNVESNLFRTLPEQLITEVVLKTITNIDQAVDWICSTFLFIRIVKNPCHYGSNIHQGDFNGARPIILKWCNNTMVRLSLIGLIHKKQSSIEPTQLARIVNRHAITVATTDLLIQLTKSSHSLDSLLVQLCQCRELFQDVIVRTNEKRFLNEMNKQIRYKFKDRFKTSTMKDSAKVIRCGQRVSRCLVEIFHHLFHPKPEESIPGNDHTTHIRYAMHFQTIVSASRLAQAFRTKLWHDSSYVARQLPKIGPTYAATLVENGYTSFQMLIGSNPREIEFSLKRNPPFGSFLVEEVKNLPKYGLSLTATDCDLVLSNEEKIKHLIRSKIQMEMKCWLNNQIGESKLTTMVLKPETHFVSLIVGCEQCDQIIWLHRFNDVALAQSVIAQKILLIRTHAKATTGIGPTAPDECKSVPGDQQLLGIVAQLESESPENSQPIHYIAENETVHTIRVLLISESFAGLDVETKLVMRFEEDFPGVNPATTATPENSGSQPFFDDDDDDQLSLLLDDFHQSPAKAVDATKNVSDESFGSDIDFTAFEQPAPPPLPSPVKKSKRKRTPSKKKRSIADIVDEANQEPKAVDNNIMAKMAECSKRFRETVASPEQRNHFVQSVIRVGKEPRPSRRLLLSSQKPWQAKQALSKYFAQHGHDDDQG